MVWTVIMQIICQTVWLSCVFTIDDIGRDFVCWPRIWGGVYISGSCYIRISWNYTPFACFDRSRKCNIGIIKIRKYLRSINPAQDTWVKGSYPGVSCINQEGSHVWKYSLFLAVCPSVNILVKFLVKAKSHQLKVIQTWNLACRFLQIYTILLPTALV